MPSPFLAICLLLPAAILAGALPARGAVHPVRADGGGPYATIQAAADSAAPGDTVELGPGVYAQTALVMDKHVVFRGRDGAAATVISLSYASRAFTLIRTGNPCVLQGITFRFCRAGKTQFPDDTGGAVAAFASPLVVRDCVFRNNNAALGTGGAIYCNVQFVFPFGPPRPIDDPADYRLYVEDTEFVENSAGNVGGALFGDDTPVVVRGCTFVDNTALQGGGVAALNYPADLEDCVFEDNRASTHGGAVALSGEGPFRVHACRFRGNAAQRLGGAALVEVSMRADVTDCAFLDNRAEFEGGAIHVRTSVFTAAGCLFRGNTAGGDGGGGVSIQDTDDGVIERCTFLDNAAPGGLSLFARRSDVAVNRSLFADTGEAVRCFTVSSASGECNAGTPGAAGCLALLPVEAVEACADDPLALCRAVSPGDCGRVGHDYDPCGPSACLVPALPTTWGALKRRY